MTESVPINQDILLWARTTAGLSIDDVVKKIGRKGVTNKTVEEWESGKSSPNYKQLERLAYEIYNRPLALFFFPEPPEETSPEQSFRTLPEYEIEHLPPRIRTLLRKAESFQLNLAELYDGINPSTKHIIGNLKFKTNTTVKAMASKVRDYLDVSLEDQSKLKDPEEAFKYWREQFEAVGIYIFKDAFKTDDFSGFCLYDDVFPIVYVNNSKSASRQIFTLFHELCHLLFETGGVYVVDDSYIDRIQGDNKKIEVLCNKFAGEFLVPQSDFSNRIQGTEINDSLIQSLSDEYSVSREVILRRLLDFGRIDQIFYARKVDSWKKSAKKKQGSGGDYYRTRGAYLGEKYIERAFSFYYQNKIDKSQLADYLDVKDKNIPGMESLLFSTGSAV